MTKYEVEQKYRVRSLSDVEQQLHGLGAEFSPAKDQVDRYFSHPCRDFAETDEAFRLRRDGEELRVTYKGPKIDATTKTRREIELPLPSGDDYLGEFSLLLRALGFRPVAEVSKRRVPARLDWHDRQVEVSLDEVQGVGSFVELEIVVGADELAGAKKVVMSLAEELRLSDSVRRSYLGLLLDERGAGQRR